MSIIVDSGKIQVEHTFLCVYHMAADFHKTDTQGAFLFFWDQNPTELAVFDICNR